MSPPDLENPSKSGLNALARYSLLGHEQELERQVDAQKPLLGDVCQSGELTVWYAEPGTGKTLLAIAFCIEAVEEKRIKAEDVFVVNMDDSGQGVLEKNRILSDLGINLLAQGYLGFSAPKLIPILEGMIADKTARGKLIVLDTIKKLADLMNKKEASVFANVARRFGLAGGTILGLAHTNKHRTAKGKLIYAGTSDIIDDFDCAYLIDSVENKCGTRTVKFENLKRRGGGVSDVTYSYSSSDEDDYLARLLSVKEVERSSYDSKRLPSNDWTEEAIIETLELAIYHTKPPTKMSILHSAAKATRLSRQKVRDVLELYTGDDPSEHRWQFVRGAHGMMLYSLLDRSSDPEPSEELVD